jgi:DNA-binding NarL/FixJ family response regulator
MTSGLNDIQTLAYALIENSNGALIIVDDERNLLDANSAGLELVGKHFDEAAGTSLDETFGDAQRLNTLLEAESTAEFELSGKPVEISSRSLELELGRIHILHVKDLSEVRKLKRELDYEKTRQRSMSVTLKNVIKSVDDEKKNIRDTLARTVKIELLPTLSKMVREDEKRIRGMYKRAVAERLFDVISDPEDPEGAALLSLTPAEMNVCRHIQAGLCTKEIAEISNSSFETIQTHRKNIRKKLGLTGEKTALYSYLKNLKSLGGETEAA